MSPSDTPLTFAVLPVHKKKAPHIARRTGEVQVLAHAMFSQLIESAMHSTPQGFVGVGLIFVYFVIMMCAIVYRIRKGDHMRH